MSHLIWASLRRVIFNPHRDLSCVSTEHWTQADPSLIKHCSRIRAQKLSDSNNNNSMSDCNLQSGPWRVNNNNQQRFSMSDCNLGRDDLCRTTIWALTIYAGLQLRPWRDSYKITFSCTLCRTSKIWAMMRQLQNYFILYSMPHEPTMWALMSNLL